MIKRLFHLCVEKLKVLGFKKESIAGIILWGMIILGATLVNYRYILFGNSWDYGGYLVKLGEIILVSGIIGGVLRFLQSTKIIEESMISLLQNTSWISELNIENRKNCRWNPKCGNRCNLVYCYDPDHGIWNRTKRTFDYNWIIYFDYDFFRKLI